MLDIMKWLNQLLIKFQLWAFYSSKQSAKNIPYKKDDLVNLVSAQEKNNHVLNVSNQIIVDIKLPFRSVLVITLKVMISIFLTSIFLFLLSLLFGTSLVAVIEKAFSR